MPTLLRELRGSVLARKPLFTLLVVATLALGIEAQYRDVFSAIKRPLVLRPLPGTRDPGSW
ncbi:MAG: hypothetical protein R2909_10315 [Gemmatimonadales bacterium]